VTCSSWKWRQLHTLDPWEAQTARLLRIQLSNCEASVDFKLSDATVIQIRNMACSERETSVNASAFRSSSSNSNSSSSSSSSRSSSSSSWKAGRTNPLHRSQGCPEVKTQPTPGKLGEQTLCFGASFEFGLKLLHWKAGRTNPLHRSQGCPEDKAQPAPGKLGEQTLCSGASFEFGLKLVHWKAGRTNPLHRRQGCPEFKTQPAPGKLGEQTLFCEFNISRFDTSQSDQQGGVI